MTDKDEVYYPPTIEDQPIGGFIAGSGQDTTGKTSTEVYKPLEEIDQQFPQTVIAHETISQTLNTRTKKILSEFTFGKSGAIKIGEYEFGVSGEIALTPNGITAKNINGDETFALDATTGDGIFKGMIAAGSLIAGTYFSVKNENNRKGIFVNDGIRDVIFIGTEET